MGQVRNGKIVLFGGPLTTATDRRQPDHAVHGHAAGTAGERDPEQLGRRGHPDQIAHREAEPECGVDGLGFTRPGYSIVRSTLAGAPAAIENGGMSAVTTELAPITQRSPTVTPLVITTLAPHHTLSPIRVGPLVVKPCHGTGLIAGRRTGGRRR